ncbi:hypothetical protein KQI65_06805 [bacterium]|nr:hypothetical protein [bacterium]
MKSVLRNAFAVLGGLIIGSVVNMGLIMVSGNVIPPPEGVDVASMESLKANMHLFEVQHFIFPFLAHALGSLVGAIFAGMLATTRKMIFAVAISMFFMIGGIMNVFILPSPTWFIVVDLVLAYIPMGLLGGAIAASRGKARPQVQA